MSFWTPSQSFWFESFETRSENDFAKTEASGCEKAAKWEEVREKFGDTIGDLGGGFKYFYFHPEIWGNDPIWLIFFKWVETTN